MNDEYLNKLRDIVLAMPVDYRLKLASVGPGYEFMRRNVRGPNGARSPKTCWQPPKVERAPTSALPGLIDMGFAVWIPVNALDIVRLAVDFNREPVVLWVDARTAGIMGHYEPASDPGGYLTALGALAGAMSADPSPLTLDDRSTT